jgi:hypothetical protein
MVGSNGEFLNSLHQEKLLTMKTRSRYVELKIGFIIGILGLGSLGTINELFGQIVPEFNSSILLWVTPIVAIGYDLYINASDLSIKRIGAFIRCNRPLVSKCEFAWEQFVTEKRGILAPQANLIFSFMATAVACVLFVLPILFSGISDIKIKILMILLSLIWFCIGGISIWGFFCNQRKLIEEYDNLKVTQDVVDNSLQKFE